MSMYTDQSVIYVEYTRVVCGQNLYVTISGECSFFGWNRARDNTCSHDNLYRDHYKYSTCVCKVSHRIRYFGKVVIDKPCNN